MAREVPELAEVVRILVEISAEFVGLSLTLASEPIEAVLVAGKCFFNVLLHSFVRQN